jgi:hypothetical protein
VAKLSQIVTSYHEFKQRTLHVSFLESIQHGLEKASQEATRIAKIQHLHNVANDLTFKASQQGQSLVGKAMEMYHQGILAQGELTAICQQIASYEQQITEVQTELQKLQSAADESAQQAAPTPAAYPGYPQAAPTQAYAPGTVPPGYPAYPMPPVGYPAQAAYPGYPPAGYPAYPGAPVQPNYPAAPGAEPPTQPLATSNEPPTSPGAPVQAGTQAQAVPHKAPAHHHAAAPAQEAPAPAAATPEQATATPLAGTYANGVLPPVFSPFTNNAAATAATGDEAEKPKAHHSAKKTASSTEETPAKE